MPIQSLTAHPFYEKSSIVQPTHRRKKRLHSFGYADAPFIFCDEILPGSMLQKLEECTEDAVGISDSTEVGMTEHF